MTNAERKLLEAAKVRDMDWAPVSLSWLYETVIEHLVERGWVTREDRGNGWECPLTPEGRAALEKTT